MSGTFKITKITFHSGNKPNSVPLEIYPESVIILVGPNNSGKSYALSQINQFCSGALFPNGVLTDRTNIEGEIINEIKFDYPINDPQPTITLALEISNGKIQGDQNSAYVNVSMIQFNQNLLTGQQLNPYNYPLSELTIKNLNYINEPENILDDYKRYSNLQKFYTAFLTVQDRFNLSHDQPLYDFQKPPINHFQALLKNDDSRKHLRNIIKRVLGYFTVIDPTSLNFLQLKLTLIEPGTNTLEKSFDQTALEYYSGAKRIDNFGSGIQAFVGLLAAAHSRKFKYLLIDEPEASLHPPLARTLGAELTDLTINYNKGSLVLATHSPDILMGCIEKAPDKVTVVRLTYNGSTNQGTAKEMAVADVLSLMRDPVVRSTGVINALFHNGAVVTEADADRVFYSEINRRLLLENRGAYDTQYLNVHGKTDIYKILGPLRKIGVPAAAIIDIDILNDSTNNQIWNKLFSACNITEPTLTDLNQKMYTLKQYINSLGTTSKNSLTKFKTDGLNALKPNERQLADYLLRILASYGLFIAPVGVLEGWLSYKKRKTTISKQDWLDHIFTQIGYTETDPNYLKPEQKDIWSFIDSIAIWINDPNRLGME